MSNPTVFDQDVTTNKRLFVNQTMDVSGTSLFKGAVTTNGNLNANGIAFFQNSAVFYKNASVANDLTTKNLKVTGMFTANYPNNSIPKSAIVGSSTFDNDVAIGGNISVKNISTSEGLNVNTDLTTTRLFVLNDETIKQRLFVEKDTTIKKRIFVSDSAEFSTNAVIGGNLTIFGDVCMNYLPNTVPSNAVISRNIYDDDLVANNRLFVANIAEFSRKVVVKDDISLNRNIMIGGNATINNLLTVKDIAVTGNLEFNSFANSSIPSTALIGGALPGNAFDTDVSLGQQLLVSGIITSKNKLNVENDASFNRSLRVGGNVTIGNTLIVKDINVSGNLAFNNFANSSIPSAAIIGGVLPANSFSANVSLDQQLSVAGQITARNKLNVENDVSFNKVMKVGGAVTLGNTLAVVEAATFAKDVTIAGNLNASFADSSIPPSKIVGGVLSVNTFATDVSMNKRLFVYDDVTAKNKLYVENDASFNKVVKIGGAVTLGNTLTVAESATFAKDVTISGNLNAGFADSSIQPSKIFGGVLPASTFAMDVSMNKRLFVYDDVTAKDKLFVEGDASFNQIMKVGGAVTLGNTLNVAEVATFAKNVTISGNLNANFANSSIPSSAIVGGALPAATFATDVSMNQRLFVYDDITTKDKLFVEGDASFNRIVKIGGAVSLGNTLTVAEAATFTKDLTVSGNLNANFANSSIPSSVIIGGALPANTFATDVSMNQQLLVTGVITAKNKLYVENDASFNRAMKVGGAVALGNTLNVAEAATFAKDVIVSGNLTANFENSSIRSSVIIGGALPANTFAADVSMNQQLLVTGIITAKNKLYVENDVSFNRAMKVGGAVALGNTLNVAEVATFAKDVNVSGVLSANFANSSIPSTVIIGGVLPANTLSNDVTFAQKTITTGDASFNGKINVANDATFNKIINATGDIRAQTRLFVIGDASIGGILTASFNDSTIPSSKIIGGALPANTLNNDVTFAQKTITNGDASFNSKINVANDATFNRLIIANGEIRAQNGLVVTGTTVANTITTNRLNVLNDTSFNGNVYVDKDLTIYGRLNVQQYTNSSVINTTTVNYATIVTEDLSVNGNITIESTSNLNNLIVTNDASFSKLIIAAGDIRAQKRLFVIGDASIGGILTASFNDSTIPSSKIIGGALPANTLNNNVTFAQKIIATGDASFNSGIIVANDASFNKMIRVTGDIRGDNRLFVNGDATIGGILTASFNDSTIPSSKIIGGALPANTFNNDVTFAQQIIANGDASFNDKLRVANDAAFNKLITVTGDIRAQNRLFVARDAQVGGTLTASLIVGSFNESSIPSSKIIGGALPANTFNNDVTFAQRIITGGDASFNNKIRVANDATFNRNISVAGNVVTQGNLSVAGDTVITGSLTASLITASFNDSTIPSSKIIGGALPANTLNSDVTFAQKIITGGDASFNGRIRVGNDATFNRTINATGDIITQGNLSVTGNAAINGILTASFNDSTIPSSKIIGGALPANTLNSDVTFAQRIITGGDASFNGRIRVANDASFNRSISATGDIITQSNLSVTGNAVINGILTASFNDGTIPSSKIIGGTLPANTLNNNVTFAQRIITGGDASFNGGIQVANDATFNKMVIATGDIRAQNRLFVTRDSSFNGNVSITGNLIATYPANSIPQSAVIGLLSGNQSAGNIAFDNDINMQKRLFVASDVSSNGLLYVSGTGTSIVKNNLTVGGTFTATSYAANSIPTSAISGLSAIINAATSVPNFSEDVSMNKRLFVSSDVSSNGLLYVSGAGTSVIKNNLTVGSLLNTNAIAASGTLAVTNATTLGSTLAVTGATTFYGTVYANNWATGVIPQSAIQGGVGSNNFTLDVSMNAKLSVGGDVSMNTKLYVAGATNLNSTLIVAGATTFNNAVQISNTTTTFTNNTVVFDNGSTTFTNGNVTIANGALTTTGNVVLSKLYVSGDASMNQKLRVFGDVSLNGSRTDICGNLYAQYPASSIPQSAIIGGVGSNNFTADVSMNSKLSVGGDVSMNSKLAVSGATILGSTLTIAGATTFTNSAVVFDNGSTTFNNGNVTITNGALTATGNVVLSKLYVSGDASMNQKLRVFGDVSLNGSRIDICGNLYAQYPANSIPQSAIISSNLFASDVSMSTKLFVGGDASMNSKLAVSGATTLGNTLAVTGAATLANTLAVTGAATLASTLAVTGSATLANTLAVTGAATLSNTLVVNNATTIGSTLAVTGSATLANTLSVTGAATLANTLVVNNATTLGSTLALTGAATLANTLAVTGASTFIGPTTHTGTLVVNNATTLGSTLSVTGAATLANTLVVNNATTLGSTLALTGAATLANTLVVNNATTLGSTLAVTGATTLASTLAVTGASTFIGPTTHTGTLVVNNATTLGSTLAVTGAATLANTLAVTGATTLSNTLVVNNATTLANTLAVTGATTLASTLAVTGKAVLNSDVSMNANIDIFGNVSIGKTLVVTGAMNLTGDVSLNRRLFVARDISVNGISIGRGNGDISTNTGFGINTLQSVTGSNNTGFGSNSMSLIGGGNQNTAFGTNALNNLTTANKNTAIGYNALSGTNSNDATTNTAIGANAGSNNSLGSSLTFLGADTTISNSTINYQNSTAIGAGAVITESNQMVLGAPGQNLNIFLNANRMSGVRSNIIDVSLINFTVESIPASAIIGSSGTSTALTGAVFIENTLSVTKLATFKENISVLGGASIGSGLALSGNLLMTDSANIGGNLTVPSINDMLTFVTYSDVPIASGLASANIDLATAWNQQSGSSGLPLGNWLGGLISETGQYQYMYDKLNPTKIYRSITYGTTFEQKSLVASIYDGVNNGNNINNVLAMDYTGKYVAIGGNQSISYSSNFGLTFNELSNTIVNSNGSKISAIAITGTGKFMFVGGTNSQLFVSTDSGTLVSVDSSPIFDQQYNNWKSISTNGSGLWTMAITDSKLFITNPGGSDTLYNGIWLNKTASKPLSMVLANVTDSFVSNDGGVFGITTTYGIYISYNHGESWIALSTLNGYNSVAYTYTRSPLLDGVYIYATTVDSGKLQKSINTLVGFSMIDGSGADMPSTTYSSVIVSGNGGYTYLFNGSNTSYRPYLQINTGGATVKVPSGTAFVLDKDAEIKQNLIVTKDTSINNRLFVTSDVSLNQKLYVANDVSMNRNVDISNNLRVNGNITMNGGSLNTTDSTETVTLFDTASVINLGGTSTNINIGTGAGTSTTVTIGANGDTVNILGNLNITGTTTTISTVNLDISDNAITLNKGGLAPTFAGAGINIEDNGVFDAGYIRVDADRGRFVVKLPALASGNPQYIATKDSSNDLSANNFTTNGNITMAGSGSLIMTGKYIKQF